MEQQRQPEQKLSQDTSDTPPQSEGVHLVENTDQTVGAEKTTAPTRTEESQHTTIPEAEITGGHIGPHPIPEVTTDRETVGRIADAIWGHLGEQIMREREEHPHDGGI